MPMSGVRSQLLPLHGELSTRSLEPAASTAGLLASMASAGSLEPLGRYGVGGLPTVTLASVDAPLASAGTARAAVEASNATKMAERRIIVDPLLVKTWTKPGRRSAVMPTLAYRRQTVKAGLRPSHHRRGRPASASAAARMSFREVLRPPAETSRPPAASNPRESPDLHDRRRLGGQYRGGLRHRTAGICQPSGPKHCEHRALPRAPASVPHGRQQRHDRTAVPGSVGLGGAPWHRAVLAHSGCHRYGPAANQRQRRLPESPASARDVCCHLAGPGGPEQLRRHRLPALPAVLRGRATNMARRGVRRRATFMIKYHHAYLHRAVPCPVTGRL